MKNRTKRLTLSALMAALSVVLLFLGNLSVILEFVMLAMASFLLVFVMLTAERGYAYLHFGVVTLLALLLLPDKSSVPLYFLLAGSYPLFKYKIDKLSRPIAYTVKLLWVNAATVAIYVLWRFVFLVPDLSSVWWVLLLTALLVNITFLLYDRALSRFVRFYFNKWESRMSRLLR